MMNSKNKMNRALKELQTLPGVGPSIAQDFVDLNIHSLEQLKTADPQELYDRLCQLRNAHIDRCILYVFRCAVYAVTASHPESSKLKWWAWKD